MDGGNSLNGASMNSPLDMVGPSPVTSNGTETTEIEDEVAPEVHTNKVTPPTKRLSASADTQATVCARNPIDDDDDVTSVIHAPEGYGSFVSRA
jgi:hypothetical protein